MSETTQTLPNAEDALDGAETDTDALTDDTGTQTPAEPENGPEDDETTDELAEARLRGDSLYELLLDNAITQGTAGVLTDPAALPRDADLYDDNGLPDVNKIRTAAQALVLAQPALAPVRGNVGQGVRETTTQDTWSSVFRNAFQ